MSDKTTKMAKAELLKMLAEAVLNTPGASRLDPASDALPEPMDKRGSAPKRVAKNKRVQAPSSRKRRR